VSTYRARLTDDWLPFPEAALRELGWQEGDEIQLEILGDTIILTKLSDGTRCTVRAAKPAKGRSIT